MLKLLNQILLFHMYIKNNLTVCLIFNGKNDYRICQVNDYIQFIMFKGRDTTTKITDPTN